MSSDHHMRNGYLAVIAANIWWGLVPIYFKLLSTIDLVEVVAHRMIWSLVFVLPVIAIRNQWQTLKSSLRSLPIVSAMMLSASLISINAITYVLAVINGHILSASFGYFLTPLVSVALGVVRLKEPLQGPKLMAILLAAAGAIILGIGEFGSLGISLTLALSFALYGFVRKTAQVEALTGFSIEMLLIFPLAVAYLIWLGANENLTALAHPQSWSLLILLGPLTSIPLLLFAFGARRLPLTTVGPLQYIAPSLVFVMGWAIYDEPLSLTKLASFVLIWIGLAIFTWDAVQTARNGPRAYS